MYNSHCKVNNNSKSLSSFPHSRQQQRVNASEGIMRSIAFSLPPSHSFFCSCEGAIGYEVGNYEGVINNPKEEIKLLKSTGITFIGMYLVGVLFYFTLFEYCSWL